MEVTYLVLVMNLKTMRLYVFTHTIRLVSGDSFDHKNRKYQLRSFHVKRQINRAYIYTLVKKSYIIQSRIHAR